MAKALDKQPSNKRLDIKSTNRPKIDTKDEDLVRLANRWIEETGKHHKELKKVQDRNEKYYLGEQTAKNRIPNEMANTVHNHVFMGVETVVPIITSDPPQFVIEPPSDDKGSVKYADIVQKVLSAKYSTSNVKAKGEQLMRDTIIRRFGVWKVYWNEKTGDADVVTVRPQRVWFHKFGSSVDDLPVIMERVDMTHDEFRDVFGEEAYEDMEGRLGAAQDRDEEKKRELDAVISLWEVWTDEVVFWKYADMIVEKKKNPYYDFSNEKNNYFKRPKKPYIFTSVFGSGRSIVGDTDLIEQTIPIQDSINHLTRSILNNANKMGNAEWRVDSSVMTEEEAREKISNAPGTILYGDGAANEGLLRRGTPPPLPKYITDMKLMSEGAFDNIFGTHSTTRGERGSSEETLGGRMLLKEADQGRLDLVARKYERAVAELGAWFLQMASMFYEEKRAFRYYGRKGVEFVMLNKMMVDQGMRVVVKPGTTKPTDEISQRNEAIKLWSLGGIDPVTLFERLKFPDPERAAQQLLAWKKGELDMEVNKEKKAAEAKAEAQGVSQDARKNRREPSKFVGGERIQQARGNL